MLSAVSVLTEKNLFFSDVSLIETQVVVVIPAFDPPTSFLDLVDTLTHQYGLGLVVVNDGSKPLCGLLFAAIGSRPGVQLVTNSRNLGKGAALRAGFKQALMQYPHLVGLVTADADGQHAPADIAALACCASNHPHHLVLGFRQFSRSVPLAAALATGSLGCSIACCWGFRSKTPKLVCGISLWRWLYIALSWNQIAMNSRPNC